MDLQRWSWIYSVPCAVRGGALVEPPLIDKGVVAKNHFCTSGIGEKTITRLMRDYVSGKREINECNVGSQSCNLRLDYSVGCTSKKQFSLAALHEFAGDFVKHQRERPV